MNYFKISKRHYVYQLSGQFVFTAIRILVSDLFLWFGGFRGNNCIFILEKELEASKFQIVSIWYNYWLFTSIRGFLNMRKVIPVSSETGCWTFTNSSINRKMSKTVLQRDIELNEDCYICWSQQIFIHYIRWPFWRKLCRLVFMAFLYLIWF